MPLEKRLKLINPKGFHVRPAARVAEQAVKFKAEIFLTVNGQKVNAKSAMNLLMVAAEQGCEVLALAEGDDEQEAIEAIEELFRVGFYDDDIDWSSQASDLPEVCGQ